MAALYRLIYRLICFATLLVVSGCGGNLMFLPMKPWVQNPARLDLAYEDIVLIHERGLRLHGWWLPAQGTPRGTVYFLHGNAQNVSTHIMSVRWLPPAGFNVFMIDYRGYGLSDGDASLPEVLEDIQLGLDWLHGSGRLGDKPLVVFGQSLGASMAIPVMAREENHGRYQCLISEAAFTGYKRIASEVMRQHWLTWGFRPLVLPAMPDGIDPVEHIAALSMPVLLLHSKEDEVIPFAHGEGLFAAASEPKEFQPLLGRHIASQQDPSVQQRLLQFVYSRCGAIDPGPAVPLRPGGNGTVRF